tara:strand:+ start:2067 stop:2183 length:117 start_codon:yes stop_codon:yes gene_type:complete
MIKKIISLFLNNEVNSQLDSKLWIQKILLERKFNKKSI